MIVDDLDLLSISLIPNKADAPLVIDPDAVLTSPAAQSIAGGSGRVLDARRPVVNRMQLRSPVRHCKEAEGPTGRISCSPATWMAVTSTAMTTLDRDFGVMLADGAFTSP
jgi:hypothetical protein